jgi:predicted aminopeptidase
VTALLERVELARRLALESVVILSAGAWRESSAACEEVERHTTGVAGDLVIVRVGDTLAAVEAPERGRRVVRRLESEAAAAEFVTRRLSPYERMWEGCGCRIDYYA